MAIAFRYFFARWFLILAFCKNWIGKLKFLAEIIYKALFLWHNFAGLTGKLSLRANFATTNFQGSQKCDSYRGSSLITPYKKGKDARSGLQEPSIEVTKELKEQKNGPRGSANCLRVLIQTI